MDLLFWCTVLWVLNTCTATPCFIALYSVVLHRCCAFINWKKKIPTHFTAVWNRRRSMSERCLHRFLEPPHSGHSRAPPPHSLPHTPLWSHALPAPDPGNHWSRLHSCCAVFSRTRQTRNPTGATCEAGFFHSAECLWDSPMLYVSTVCSFLLLRNIPLWVCQFAFQSHAEEHLGWFQFGASMNRATVNIRGQVI